MVTLEDAINRAGAEAHGHLRRLGAHLPRVRPSRRLILLVMAAFPLAVGPAVLAAVYISWALAQPGDSKSGETRWYGTILGLALVNIALSLWFWGSFGNFFLERASELFDRLIPNLGDNDSSHGA